MMSTYWDGDQKVLRLRKRPKLSSSKAKTARKPFGGEPTKMMEIPQVYDAYNHQMGAVDLADQLQGNNGDLRRIKRGGAQAVDQSLLLTVFVNIYLPSLYSEWPEEPPTQPKYRSQNDFRISLIEALFKAGQDAQVPRKRSYAGINMESYKVPVHQHRQIKMATRSNCVACKGGRHHDRPPKRVALAELAVQNGRTSTRVTSSYGCKECHVHLCRKGSCWERYHTFE